MLYEHIISKLYCADLDWFKRPKMSHKLAPNMVDIWYIMLPIPKELVIELYEYLSNDELARLEKLRYDDHKIRFIAARGGLRSILSRYIHNEAKEISFSYTYYRKPYLNNSNLSFNLSHSGNCIIYAITEKVAIGIDVEQIKLGKDFLAIARRFFSKNEYVKLLSLKKSDLPLAFYRCWTRKEAYLKAIGCGLHCRLDQIEVSLLPQKEAKLIKLADNSASLTSWHMIEMMPHFNYIVTILIQQNINICND